ncbi:hypothetical protein [Mycoplasmoides pirum]|uniref:hypothetical protein n=1 Tax=Mycoplasmoides pirum TaxID=2122 RepID=UPI00047FEFD5|nr:hypothetical protein [Mycoplasmoides pirum]
MKNNFLNFKLFYRPYTSPINQIKITNLLFDILNVNNVLDCREKNLKPYYSIEHEKDFLAYKFEILSNWIKKNEFYNNWYTLNLNKIIKLLNIKNFFNSLEIDYINKINSLDFENKRIYKKIIVDFSLNKNEYALFSIDEISLFQVDIKDQKSKNLLGNNFKLYVTNKAIVVTNNIYKIRISYSDSLSFKLIDEGIYWYAKNIDFIFQTHDKYLLYEYIKKMFFDNLKKSKKKLFCWPKGYLNR